MDGERRALILFLLLRVAVGAWALGEPLRLFNGDSALYFETARPALAETTLADLPGRGTQGSPDDPWRDMIRPPGYPIVIGLLGGSHILLLLVNLAASVGIWFGVRRLAGEGWARVRWALVADPVFLFYGKEFLTEYLFAAAILWSIIHIRESAYMKAGAWVGLGTLLKPIGFYLPVVGAAGALGWMAWNRKWNGRMGIAVLLAAGLPFLWQLRNRVEHGTWAYTSIAAENLMTGHAAFVLADAEGLSHHQAQDSIRALYRQQVGGVEPTRFAELSAAKTAVAGRILGDHPFIYMKRIGLGMVFTLVDPGRELWARTFGGAAGGGITATIARDGVWATLVRLLRESPGLVLYAGVLGVFWIMAVRGWWNLRLQNPALFWLLTLLFGYLWVLGGPIGYARFRLYLWPLGVVFVSRIFFEHRTASPQSGRMEG